MDNPKQKLKINFKTQRKKLLVRARRAESVTQRHTKRFIMRRIDNMRLVMSEIAVWMIGVAFLIAMLSVQYLWSVSSYTEKSFSHGGIYVEGMVGSVNTLNPLLASTEPELSAAKLLFSSLYSYDATGKIHTDLAKTVSIEEGKKYTVKLRDAKWHDGEKLTAEDVVYTIDLIKDARIGSAHRTSWLDVSVRAVDSSTVEFVLPAPYAGFIHALTFPIIPKHILKDVDIASIREDKFSKNPVGSGKFMVKLAQTSDSTNTSDVLRLVPNDKYYGEIPKLTRLELRTYSSEAALLTAVKNGEVSGAIGLGAESIEAINKSKYSVQDIALNNGVYLLMNNNSSILQDQKVREALRLATDTAAIRKAVGGDNPALDGPILQNQVTHKLPKAPAVDVDAARKKLEEAEWKYVDGAWKKGDVTLTVSIVTSSGRDDYTKALHEVERQWKVLGVKVNSRQVDVNSAASGFVQSVLQPRDYDVLLYELALGADPDVFAYWHSSQARASGYNFANYSNNLADTHLLSARSRLEPELRSAKYAQFVEQWLADVPAIGLYQSNVKYVSNNSSNIVSVNGSLASIVDRYATVSEWRTGSTAVYKTP